MGKGRDKVFKREEQEKKRDVELEDFCDEKVLKEIKKWVRNGAVIMLVANGEYAPMQDFYKALYGEMKKPVYNGACIYDAKVAFNDAWERRKILITLNDAGNIDIVERIQELNPLKHKTVYSNLRSS